MPLIGILLIVLKLKPITNDLVIGAEDRLPSLLLLVLRLLFLDAVLFNDIAVNAQTFGNPAHAVPLSMKC